MGAPASAGAPMALLIGALLACLLAAASGQEPPSISSVSSQYGSMEGGTR